MQVLKRRLLYRYVIVTLGLTGPLLQLSKTVASEVCSIPWLEVLQTANVVCCFTDPATSNEPTSRTLFATSAGTACSRQASTRKLIASDELDVDGPR